ncbi:4'-phosphopantetheinyl transferase family protein [Paenibacillus sp. FA6]|uniref:4'-phosphopantetheinyl transferase family protein n=1 Tax=Paenibacillus sp. FA6 TaxID=3413029 RepID=UPI003F65E924
MTQVYGVKLMNGIDPLQMQTLMATLPMEKQDRIHRFIHRDDAVRTLTADILSRLRICNKLNIKNSDIQFIHNKNGKPLLHGNDGLHFNNSHSGQWVLCALSDSPVGIDVELISDIDFDIAEHCFSEQECHDLYAHREDNRQDYFFDLWTLKESYIKAVGIGLSLPLSSFTIRKDDHHILIDTQHAFNNCYFKQYSIDPAYKVSVCSQQDTFQEKVVQITFTEMFHQFMDCL